MSGSLLALRREGRGKFGRAQGRRFQPMPQFQAEIPHPLRNHLPALLPPGGVATPAIGVLLVVFICQSRQIGSAMQIHLDDISSSERLLRQVREEEFVDDACPCDANATLLGAGWVGCHHHAQPHALGSHWHFWAVVEAAYCLTLQSAAGTDQGADAGAPGPADDQVRCTLCHELQKRIRPGQRVPLQCRIGRRYGVRREPVGVGAP